jgi:hypothetical protein
MAGKVTWITVSNLIEGSYISRLSDPPVTRNFPQLTGGFGARNCTTWGRSSLQKQFEWRHGRWRWWSKRLFVRTSLASHLLQLDHDIDFKIYSRQNIPLVRSTEISMSQHLVELYVRTFAFLRLPRFELFWNALEAMTSGPCNALLRVAVATKSSSSRIVSRVAHRGVGFLAIFLRFCDGRDILCFMN